MQYLSTHPEGLVEALITGGLPPGIHQPCSAEEAYVHLYRCVDWLLYTCTAISSLYLAFGRSDLWAASMGSTV